MTQTVDNDARAHALVQQLHLATVNLLGAVNEATRLGDAELGRALQRLQYDVAALARAQQLRFDPEARKLEGM